jgi:hypothetical protein
MSARKLESYEILKPQDLGLTLEQFAQLTDAEVFALSNARLDASIAELNRDLDEDGATPEDAEGEANQAALDAKEVVEKEQRLTADQHLTEAQKSASEQREAARLAFKKAQAQADKLCRLAPRGSQGEAYTAILQALFNDSIYGSSLADVAGAFKYPKVQGNQRDFVIGPVAGSNEGWFPR